MRFTPGDRLIVQAPNAAVYCHVVRSETLASLPADAPFNTELVKNIFVACDARALVWAMYRRPLFGGEPAAYAVDTPTGHRMLCAFIDGDGDVWDLSGRQLELTAVRFVGRG